MLSEETFAFLAELAANNNKPWFDANRDRYEELYLRPAQAFVQSWEARLRHLTPTLKAEPRINGSIRRIHRDTRFSTTNQPYHPRIHLVFWAGDHPQRSPAIHLVVYPDKLAMGAGQWSLTKAELSQYYDAVVADGS